MLTSAVRLVSTMVCLAALTTVARAQWVGAIEVRDFYPASEYSGSGGATIPILGTTGGVTPGVSGAASAQAGLGGEGWARSYNAVKSYYQVRVVWSWIGSNPAPNTPSVCYANINTMASGHYYNSSDAESSAVFDSDNLGYYRNKAQSRYNPNPVAISQYPYSLSAEGTTRVTKWIDISTTASVIVPANTPPGTYPDATSSFAVSFNL